MKAIRLHRYGGSENLKLDEVEKPSPGPRDVLVEVHASAVNPIDWKIRRGYQRAFVWWKLPWIPGFDVSGVVVEVGSEVDKFKVGDEVYSSPPHTRPGTYAEYIAIDQDQVALKPSNITHGEAASVPLAGLTAWQCLETANLEKGQKIFIQAGSGGVGVFAIQFARARGAVISTTCSDRNSDLVTELGADQVINYREQDYTEILEEQDVILECLGWKEVPRCRKILKKGGVITSINSGMGPNVEKWGPYFGALVTVRQVLWHTLFMPLLGRHRFKPVLKDSSGEDLAAIGKLIEEGKVRPIVDKTFPLEDVPKAHEYSETGRARGKIVIQVK